MAKYRLYQFNPINPDKFRGETLPIIMRSSWEIEFAKTCDLLPTVVSWNYEAVQIPYRDPITGKQKIYIPDFFVERAEAGGFTRHFVYEIKPMHEQKDEFARNSADSMLVARNHAKWGAAIQWCDRHSAEFVILNESDLFSGHENRQHTKFSASGMSHTNSIKKAKAAVYKSKKATAVTTAKTAISRMKTRIENSRATKVSTVRKVKKI